MLQIKDLREDTKTKERLNNQTELLEEIIKKNNNPSRLKKFMKNTGENIALFTSMIGAGYLAGYIAGSGNTDTAVEFAEYSSLLCTAWFLAGLPYLFFQALSRKKINEKPEIYQEKIKKEAEKAQELDRQGKLHAYKPTYGLSFTNHPYNPQSSLEHKLRNGYERSLKISKKPIISALETAIAGGLIFCLSSVSLDIITAITDWTTGFNPITYGVNTAHHVSTQLQSLAGYTASTPHEHADNFTQLNMFYTGAMFGVLYTAKEFLTGSYYKLKSLFRQPKIQK